MTKNKPYEFQDSQLAYKLRTKQAETALGTAEYVEIGDGPPVITLHGAMGGYDQSLLLAQTIGSTEYRYIAMSRPGYLGTPMSSGRTSEQQGDLVAALLDKLDISEAGVMAVSGGGPSAIQFGLRHPDRCAGLILVSTCAGKLDTSIPFSFKVTKFLARWSWFVRQFHKKAEKNLAEVAKRSIRDPEILNRTINDADAWALFSALLLSTFDRMEQRLQGTENDIEVTRSTIYPLENLSVPVLAIHGTDDQVVPYEAHAKAFEARVPDAELLTVEGGEHVTIFTHRGMVRPKVNAFMRNHFCSQEEKNN